MSGTNAEFPQDVSSAAGSGGPYERPKSRLPRLPQPSTPKPPDYDAPDLMNAVKSLQKATNVSSAETKINNHALSVRQYLESTVVPILMKGLLTVVRERPEDPIEYLAAYLTKNNPNRMQEDDHED